MIELCGWCAVDHACRFEWSNVCCRVRFTLRLKSRDERVAWLDRWAEQDGAELAKVVRAEVVRRWNVRA